MDVGAKAESRTERKDNLIWLLAHVEETSALVPLWDAAGSLNESERTVEVEVEGGCLMGTERAFVSVSPVSGSCSPQHQRARGPNCQ